MSERSCPLQSAQPASHRNNNDSILAAQEKARGSKDRRGGPFHVRDVNNFASHRITRPPRYQRLRGESVSLFPFTVFAFLNPASDAHLLASSALDRFFYAQKILSQHTGSRYITSASRETLPLPRGNPGR